MRADGTWANPVVGIILTFTFTAGSSYTNGTYTNTLLSGGTGTGARATITVTSGAVTAVTITNAGSGYNINDSLTTTVMGSGTGFAITITNVSTVGTVTSVAATTSSNGLTISGSPIISKGTLTFTLGTELQGVNKLSTTGLVQRTGTGTYSTTTAVNSLAAGSGISISSSTGNITISNTGVTSLTGTANQIAVSSSTGSAHISLTSPLIIPAPASGCVLQITTLANTNGVQITQGDTGTDAGRGLTVLRGGSTANTVYTGPNIMLKDTTNATDTVLQQSGGQTELWQTNGSATTQILCIDTAQNIITNRSVYLNGPVQLPDNTWITSSDSLNRLYFAAGAHNYYNTEGNHYFQYNGSTILTIGTTGNIIIGSDYVAIGPTGIMLSTGTTLSTSNSVLQFSNDTWNTSYADNHNRLYFTTSGGTHFWAAGGHYHFTNASSADIVTIDMSGNIVANGDVTGSSDVALKTEIQSISDALDKVCTLNGITFKRKSQTHNKRSMGLLAQDVEKIAPELIGESTDGFKTLAYGNMAGLFVEAIKELRETVEKIERRLGMQE
jgi:hypothetical protein